MPIFKLSDIKKGNTNWKLAHTMVNKKFYSIKKTEDKSLFQAFTIAQWLMFHGEYKARMYTASALSVTLIVMTLH